MHYKNGREAKPGDRVVKIDKYGTVVGVLHDIIPSTDSCNGQVAPITSPSVQTVTIGECLHIDDVIALLDAVKPA